MRVLEGLRPEAPLYFFEELCAIPHGSHNTKQISDYCVAFARERGLRYVQDASNNVVIYKPASPGYEGHPTVILQGHLDMVCEKDPGCDIDFLHDGLRLKHDGTSIYAEGTTLGGDDGIAVAYGLALLDSKEMKHPPLEVVFTVDEEVGMLGADALDCALLSGRTLINCDSEDEGVLTVSCAGGARVTLRLPLTRETKTREEDCLRVSVCGLTGGHSGVEINKGRANANKLLAKWLEKLPVNLIGIGGGSQDNAIPREACAVLRTPAAAKIAAELFERLPELRKTLPPQEREVRFVVEAFSCDTPALTAEASAAVLALLNALPNGIQSMSRAIEGLVQTSLNLGIVAVEGDMLRATFSVRSSVNSEKEALLGELRAIADRFGAAYKQSGEYPAWEYRENSRLRDVMVETYRELYGSTPIVEAIHAGLECGIFSDRLPGLDAVSFGPKMRDIHTSREKLDIASAGRTWDYLCKILEAL